MAAVGDIVKNFCVEDWLEEIFMIPQQRFKDLSNQGFVYSNRRLRDLGNYKYAVLYQFMVRLAPHHCQQNISWKLTQLAERYQSLHGDGSATDAGIEMRGDVIEYCLHHSLMTGPAIPDKDREWRLSFNSAVKEFGEAYDSLIRGLCAHPPIVRECPPPDWFSKTICLAVAAKTSGSKARHFTLQYCRQLTVLLNDRHDRGIQTDAV